MNGFCRLFRLVILYILVCVFQSKYYHFLLGIENSKAVIDAGLLIQKEAANYILSNKGLCKALCFKQLLGCALKLQNLENLIQVDQFTSQMLDDQLLLDQVLVEINLCHQVLLFMEKFELSADLNDQILKQMHAFANVFKQFKNMIGSYFAIILQEGLKSCQAEKSMEIESTKIEAIIGPETTLSEIIKGVENGDEKCKTKASKIKEKFVNFVQELSSKNGALSSGQMIIMAINALLDNIDTALGSEMDSQRLLASQLSRLLCLRHFFALCFRSRDSFKGKISCLFLSIFCFNFYRYKVIFCLFYFDFRRFCVYSSFYFSFLYS